MHHSRIFLFRPSWHIFSRLQIVSIMRVEQRYRKQNSSVGFHHTIRHDTLCVHSLKTKWQKKRAKMSWHLGVNSDQEPPLQNYLSDRQGFSRDTNFCSQISHAFDSQKENKSLDLCNAKSIFSSRSHLKGWVNQARLKNNTTNGKYSVEFSHTDRTKPFCLVD